MSTIAARRCSRFLLAALVTTAVVGTSARHFLLQSNAPADLNSAAYFSATMTPLGSTTGVELGGSGVCTLYYEPQNGAGSNRVNVAALIDPDAQGNVVAIHVHKGGPNENGPIVVNVCASASPFSSMTNAVEKPDGGRFAAVPPACAQSGGGQYGGQVLMDPSLPEFSSLTEFFNQFIPNPEAFYCNLHTDKSETFKAGVGLIRGQFSRVSGQ